VQFDFHKSQLHFLPPCAVVLRTAHEACAVAWRRVWGLHTARWLRWLRWNAFSWLPSLSIETSSSSHRPVEGQLSRRRSAGRRLGFTAPGADHLQVTRLNVLIVQDAHA
jgi:hypothetical protein